MSLQELIVLIIVLVCVNYACIRIVRYIFRVKNNDSPCTGCPGCNLKETMDAKKELCKDIQKT